MAKIRYQTKRFSAGSQAIIVQANRILNEYEQQGYDLTLRQLYYQFVARGLIANKDTEYKRLGSIINDARLAGKIDWNHIVDRTRNLRELAHWESPADIVDAVSKQFRVNYWDTQPEYVEVWIEKDALIGVIQGVCKQLDVPHFSCRGYVSQSEMWSASQRIGYQIAKGKKATILHLGDHDPSGIDMTRDIRDRLFQFIATDAFQADDREDREAARDDAVHLGNTFLDVNRIALTMDQVEEYGPPPNPAKLTDARARGYVEEYGDESWELDALDPTTLSALIRDNVEALIDQDAWDEAHERQVEGRELLAQASGRWAEIVELLS